MTTFEPKTLSVRYAHDSARKSVKKRIFCACIVAFACADALAADAVVGTGTPASCTETMFNAALALVINDNIGGTLTFNCGPDPGIILFSAPKNLINFVVIDGGGKMTLDGQDQTRLFNINQDGVDGRTEVTLRNINLNRGNTGAEAFGGAVLVNANTRLSLEQVSVSNSLASVAGGAIATFAGVVLDVRNSHFISNQSANGGAIATRAILNVADSSFTNNIASGGEGGAIQSYEQNLIISGSSFTGNSARFGGAIFKSGAQMDFRDANFAANTSGDDGGAIYLRADVASVLSRDTVFWANAAARDGGGVFSKSIFASERSSFAGNSARAGGAIRMEGGGLLLDKVTLNDNTAQIEGGAISALTVSTPLGLNGNPEIRQTTTSNNTVTAGFGGDFAFTSSNGVLATIKNTSLMGGSASSGGSTLYLNGIIFVEIARSLLWARAGSTCSFPGVESIFSSGSNIGASACGLNAPSDAISETFAGFGLGEFAHYGGRTNTFLPQPGSAAIDRGGSDCAPVDARDRPAPLDGDGNGSVLCDAGAVERQLLELPAALFRNGFE